MHNGSQILAILQLQNRISTPKRRNDDFEARFKRNFKRKISSVPNQQICCQSTATFMQSLLLECDLRLPAAKRNSITHAAAARSILDAAIPLRSAGTELQNTIELCTTAHKLLRFCSSKTRSRRQSGKMTILKRVSKGILKGKSSMPNQQICFKKHHSHVSRCHYNALHDSELQNAIVLRMQLPQGATVTQPFHRDLQTLSYKTQ